MRSTVRKADTPTWVNELRDSYANLLSDVCRDVEDRTSYAAVALWVHCSEINDNWWWCKIRYQGQRTLVIKVQPNKNYMYNLELAIKKFPPKELQNLQIWRIY